MSATGFVANWSWCWTVRENTHEALGLVCVIDAARHTHEFYNTEDEDTVCHWRAECLEGQRYVTCIWSSRHIWLGFGEYKIHKYIYSGTRAS